MEKFHQATVVDSSYLRVSHNIAAGLQDNRNNIAEHFLRLPVLILLFEVFLDFS
jgi:hypothetical protein